MRLSKADSAKVESITVEEGGFDRNIQYWVELNAGYCFEDEGLHCFGEDTQKLVRESLMRVRPCNCAHHCALKDSEEEERLNEAHEQRQFDDIRSRNPQAL